MPAWVGEPWYKELQARRAAARAPAKPVTPAPSEPKPDPPAVPASDTSDKLSADDEKKLDALIDDVTKMIDAGNGGTGVEAMQLSAEDLKLLADAKAAREKDATNQARMDKILAEKDASKLSKEDSEFLSAELAAYLKNSS